MLLYTDGVTEARNPHDRCYRLVTRLTELAATSADGIRPDLLECLRDDLRRHVGAAVGDDAALVLVIAQAAWGGQVAEPAQATAP